MSTTGGDSGWGERKQLRMNRWQFFFLRFSWTCSMLSQMFQNVYGFVPWFPSSFQSFFILMDSCCMCSPLFSGFFMGFLPTFPLFREGYKNRQNPCMGDFIVPQKTGTQKNFGFAEKTHRIHLSLFLRFLAWKKQQNPRLWGSTSRSYNPSYPCTRPFIGTSTPFLTPPPRNTCSI